MSKVTLTLCAGKDRKLTWVRKDEDYVADFCLVSRRTLTDFEHLVFTFCWVRTGGSAAVR